MTPHQQYGDVISFLLAVAVCLSPWPPWASIVLALGVVVSLCETLEELFGLENTPHPSPMANRHR